MSLFSYYMAGYLLVRPCIVVSSLSLQLKKRASNKDVFASVYTGGKNMRPRERR